MPFGVSRGIIENITGAADDGDVAVVCQTLRTMALFS